MNTHQRHNNKICFICGAPHSGSTLLGFILGSHRSCFYLGESKNIKFFGQPNVIEQKRVCKLCGKDCQIWGNFRLSNKVDLYEQLSKKTAKPIMIDSTKNTAWIKKQLATLQHTPVQRFLIFLQRDGRAVINSRIRKAPTKAIETIVTDWITQIELTYALFERFDGAKIKVHYEDLATQPASVIQALCELINIPYEPEMLTYYQYEHHPLGGNEGTQFLVGKAQNDSGKTRKLRLSDRNRDYYANHPPEIILDLRWKQELNPEAAFLFEKLAGSLNRESVWEMAAG